jgi:hypothetical protein
LHPYAAAELGHSGFVDLKADPDKIPLVLEDFVPFAHTAAVQTFYDFLRWINGQDSVLETNDCLLRPPMPNNSPNASPAAFVVPGRVGIHYRDLALNASPAGFQWLCQRLNQALFETDPRFPAAGGVVGLGTNDALYLAISNGNWIGDQFQLGVNDPGMGKLIILNFWGFGNDPDAAFENLRRVFSNIWAACREVSAEAAAPPAAATDPGA